MSATGQFASQLVRGSVWMIGMRWALRLTGLVSTAVLARLLMPADFGIIAMASIFAGLLDTVAYTGVDLALIRSGPAARERMDSAWTIQAIQGVIVAALLVAVAPVASAYFHEPRVTTVMLWLAFKSVLDGLQNIGVVEFRRGLEFHRDFKFNLYGKLINLVVVIACALYFRNYLALVGGFVSASVVVLVLSYTMHPYRPRFSLREARHLWSFSNWLMLSRIGSFTSHKADQFIVGGTAGAAAIGAYNVATELATMPTSELVMPMRRALFPTLSTLQGDPAAFRAATLRTFEALAILCFSFGFGMLVTANEMVELILGSKWHVAVPLVRWLALYGAVAGLASILEVPIWVKGRASVSALVAGVELAALVPLLIVMVRWQGVEGAAMSRAAVGALILPMMLWLTARTLSLRLRDLLLALWRPFTAAVLMALCVGAPLPFPQPAILSLAAKVAIGGVVYGASLLALWWLSGMPEGAERTILQTVGARLVKWRNAF